MCVNDDANDKHIHVCRDEEGDEGTQAANINELFDYSLELLWSLVTKNGWDQTKLPVSCPFNIINSIFNLDTILLIVSYFYLYRIFRRVSHM